MRASTSAKEKDRGRERALWLLTVSWATRGSSWSWEKDREPVWKRSMQHIMLL